MLPLLSTPTLFTITLSDANTPPKFLDQTWLPTVPVGVGVGIGVGVGVGVAVGVGVGVGIGVGVGVGVGVVPACVVADARFDTGELPVAL